MEARDKVVANFREGKTRVLIATDVLARGFDVQQVGGFLASQVQLCDSLIYWPMRLSTFLAILCSSCRLCCW